MTLWTQLAHGKNDGVFDALIRKSGAGDGGEGPLDISWDPTTVQQDVS